ncbi:MAG: nicotinamide riboside transporter PnuC [bacterium]
MNPIELAATIMGVISVVLTVRQNIWCWPTGLVMVTLYIFVFYDARLYSDMVLQVIYIFMQVYGWYYWLRGAQNQAPEVRTLTQRERGLWAVVAVLGIGGLGTAMGTYTDAALPYWDAATTVLSLVAQWLLGRKVLENWVIWIAVDVLAIGIYINRELYLTAGLYGLFLGLAATGLWTWIRARENVQPA